MDNRVRRAGALCLAYAAIGIGLFLFKSGWLAIGLYHAGMMLYLVHRKRRIPPRLLWTGRRTAWFGLLPVGALGGVAVVLLWPAVGLSADLNSLLSRYGLSGWKWTAFMVYFVLFHPVLEELFWRGGLQHPSKVLRIEDAAFAGYHVFTMLCFVRWPWALMSFFLLTGAAWAWRQSVRRTGGLFVAASSHVIADAAIVQAACAILSK